jgi:hypothetical protein
MRSTKPMPGRPGGSGGVNYKKDLNAIIAEANVQLSKIKDASMRGLINAAIFIRNETETKPLSTPVDLGNLRSSWFITTATKKSPDDQWNKGFRNALGEKGRKKKDLSGKASKLASGRTKAIGDAKSELTKMNMGGNKEFLMMGYSARYAGYVHEFVNPDIKFKRKNPQSGAKWFQQHVYGNTNKIFQIVAATSKMKK